MNYQGLHDDHLATLVDTQPDNQEALREAARRFVERNAKDQNWKGNKLRG